MKHKKKVTICHPCISPYLCTVQTGHLSEEELKRYQAQLDHLMEKEKVFLQSQLNLSGLASMLSISPHLLSKISPATLPVRC